MAHLACRPNLNSNITSALTTDPFNGPSNGTANDSDAVSSGPTSSSYAAHDGSWANAALRQERGRLGSENGRAIDTYATRLRFGVASFDSLDAIPSNHQTSSLRSDPVARGCQFATDGSPCSLTYFDEQRQTNSELRFGGATGRWPASARRPCPRAQELHQRHRRERSGFRPVRHRHHNCAQRPLAAARRLRPCRGTSATPACPAPTRTIAPSSTIR
jgi:hypothetical protein